jgi:uncharacterized membrane protein YhaH (DUF805 family)
LRRRSSDAAFSARSSSSSALAILYPSLAVAAKRFHDRDKSGWWVLIIFIPIVGIIWYIVELGCLPGTPGPNRFGSDPLGAPALPGRA